MGSAIGIFVALVVAEVFNRREIPVCDDGNGGEFGLIRMEPRASDGHGHPQVASHSITVTNEYDSNPNNGAQQRLEYVDGGVMNAHGHYQLGRGGGHPTASTYYRDYY